MATTTNTFEIGTTYEARSACDYDCIFRFTVTKRTAKFITVDNSMGETKRVGIKTWDGVEAALPLDSYSMAPVIKADRPSVAA